MKVQEKGTDRRAELHMHVQEKVEELTEYGQYIDPSHLLLRSGRRGQHHQDRWETTRNGKYNPIVVLELH
jgi:hypothetical protein